MERMTITLTDEQAERINAAVESGEYASHSEVIREALRDWELHRSIREQVVAELRAEIDKGWQTSKLDGSGSSALKT